MSVTLFVFPLKPKKKQDYFNFMNECLTTKKDEYKDLLKCYGCNNITMWSHTLAGIDYALFTHDLSDDAFDRMSKWNESTHPFDRWFDKKLREFIQLHCLLSKKFLITLILPRIMKIQ